MMQHNEENVMSQHDEESFIRQTIGEYFGTEAAQGTLTRIKQGMTNDSYIFTANGAKYIFRYNGAGSERLIDRANEKHVYELVCPTGITEEVVTISVTPGYKISHYFENSHVCDVRNFDETRRSMEALRSFHERRITGVKSFDPFDELCRYESMLPKDVLDAADYQAVRAEVVSLRPYLLPFLTENTVLCHVDSLADNFLFVEGVERPYILDWEYAGLCDPLFDVAQFALYADYAEDALEQLIADYFPEGVDDGRRARVYGYIVVGGFLWYDWCIYRGMYGADLSDYAARQLCYVKAHLPKARALLGA